MGSVYGGSKWRLISPSYSTTSLCRKLQQLEGLFEIRSHNIIRKCGRVRSSSMWVLRIRYVMVVSHHIASTCTSIPDKYCTSTKYMICENYGHMPKYIVGQSLGGVVLTRHCAAHLQPHAQPHVWSFIHCINGVCKAIFRLVHLGWFHHLTDIKLACPHSYVLLSIHSWL